MIISFIDESRNGFVRKVEEIIRKNKDCFQPEGKDRRVAIAVISGETINVIEVLPGKKIIVEPVISLSDFPLPEKIRAEIYSH